MAAGASSKNPKVKAFLEIRIQRTEPEARLLGLCAGYEAGKWRAEAFAKSLVRHLPQFALPIEEWDSFNSATGVEQLARAAKIIYQTKKYERRGEVGELMLFSIMRLHYNSEPVISKFYFKSSANDTVKGFDAVHVVTGAAGLELWLGEVKFYTSLPAAVRDVLKELDNHLKHDFMRQEFMWIEHKMGGGTSHADEIRRLLDDSTSLDEVFEVLNIPILLTYQSSSVRKHRICDATYKKAIADELSAHFDDFRRKSLPKKVRIHLILVPLEGKARLLREFDALLSGLQSL